MHVKDELFDFLRRERTLKAMYLKPVTTEDGLIRDAQRVRFLQEPLAKGRSEDKLMHIVKGFLMVDQYPGGEETGRARRPVRRLAASAMK